jgi:hypothetical protein
VRRAIDPVSLCVNDSVVSESRVHPAPSLVLERCVRERQAAITEAAAMVLALNHDFDSAFVFPPALWRVGADFSSVRVHADRTVVEDDGVAHGLLRVEVGARDGAAADQKFPSDFREFPSHFQVSSAIARALGGSFGLHFAAKAISSFVALRRSPLYFLSKS